MEICNTYTRRQYEVFAAGANGQCEWRKRDKERREPGKIGKEK